MKPERESEDKVMSNSILRNLKRSFSFIVFCLALTLLAAAGERPDFSGTWKLNHPGRGEILEHEKQIIDNRHGVHGDADDQSGTTTDHQYSYILQALEGVWAPPEELVLRLDDPNFALSDGANDCIVLHTDGRVDKFPGGVETITRWIDATLVTATRTRQNSTITTYVMARGGYHMLVSIEGNIAKEEGSVVTRYTYDYASVQGVSSSSFWQLHAPVYHRDTRQSERWFKTARSLADDANKEIAKSPRPNGNVLDSFRVVLPSQPVPPSTVKSNVSDEKPEPHSAYGSNPLRAFDSDLRTLTEHVSSAVVQVIVDRYGPEDGDNAEQAAFVAEQKSVASGVIVDPSGYILTNAHVVSGAWQVRVLLTKRQGYSDMPLAAATEEPIPAIVVGGSDYFDLALLKIDSTNLPSLSFASLEDIRQGQIVVAVGSPMGLDNSVSMGIVSSIARQANPNSPLVYLQTDAAVNQGNSGGALVDVNGHLVGINTSIFSHSGGSEGIGFALPAPTVKMVYDSIREKGYMGRRGIGVATQPITSVLARGLDLSSAHGLVVCDVLPGSSGEQAGVKIGDVLLEADSRPVGTPAQLEERIYDHDLGQPLTLTVLRGDSKLSLQLRVVEAREQNVSIAGLVDPLQNSVLHLGIIATTLTSNMAGAMGGVRVRSGVVVIARTLNAPRVELSPGDIIHSINGRVIDNMATLRDLVAQFKQRDPVVLLVERQGGLAFISFEMD
jgi:serine protease Do